MYKQKFDEFLKGQIPKSTMLYGESLYYIEQYIEILSFKIEASQVLKIYPEDYNFDLCKATLSQGSLFGDKTLCIYKGQKALTKEELKALIHLCQKNDNSYFIYALHTNKKPTTTTLFAPKLQAQEVRFFEPNPNVAIAELAQKAKELHIQIDKHVLQHLLLVLNMDIQLAANELRKLSILSEAVTTKDIDNLVYATSAIKVENLFFDLMDKKPVIEHLVQLLDTGDDCYKILRQAQYFFAQLFLFRSYIALHGRVNSKEILGYQLPQFVEEKKSLYAQKLKILQYNELFKRLLYAEIELKKADAIQRDALLITTILNIQTLVK